MWVAVAHVKLAVSLQHVNFRYAVQHFKIELCAILSDFQSQPDVIQPGIEPGSVMTPIALWCSALDRCSTPEPTPRHVKNNHVKITFAFSHVRKLHRWKSPFHVWWWNSVIHLTCEKVLLACCSSNVSTFGSANSVTPFCKKAT